MDDDVETPTIGNGNGGIFSFISQHFMLIGVTVIILFVVITKLKIKGTNNTTVTPAVTGDLSGLTKDSNGNSIVYRDTADSFYNYSDIENSFNSPVNNSVTDTSSTSVVTNPIIQSTPPGSTPVNQPSKPPTSNSKGSWNCNYAVKSGDTLSGIASKYGTDWHSIYSHNINTIDTVSHAHGNPIAGGTWNNIFPGEVLVVPCK